MQHDVIYVTCGYFIKNIKLVLLLVLLSNVNPILAIVPLKIVALFICRAYIEIG